MTAIFELVRDDDGWEPLRSYRLHHDPLLSSEIDALPPVLARRIWATIEQAVADAYEEYTVEIEQAKEAAYEEGRQESAHTISRLEERIEYLEKQNENLTKDLVALFTNKPPKRP